MIEIELKPCPFCGSTDIDFIDDDWVGYVYCTNCGVETPNYKPSTGAVEAWNRRADNESR